MFISSCSLSSERPFSSPFSWAHFSTAGAYNMNQTVGTGPMARIQIIHTTEYTYRNPVGLLRHRLMLRPDDSHDLRLHKAELKVDPAPASALWKHDVFNNSVCYLEWPQTLRTNRLSIVSSLDLSHHPALILAEEAVQAVIDLEHRGLPFNRTPDGRIDQRRFGGHTRNFGEAACPPLMLCRRPDRPYDPPDALPAVRQERGRVL